MIRPVTPPRPIRAASGGSAAAGIGPAGHWRQSHAERVAIRPASQGRGALSGRHRLPWPVASRRGTPSLAWWPLVPRRLAV